MIRRLFHSSRSTAQLLMPACLAIGLVGLSRCWSATSVAADAKPAQPAPAAEKPASTDAKPASENDPLLDDLDQELLEGSGLSPEAQPKKPAADAARADDAPDAAGEDIGQSSEQNPLLDISRQMRAAEELIEARKSIPQTERVQGKIVTDLAKLIEELEKQCQNPSSGQCNNPKSGKGQGTAARKPVRQPQSQAKPGDKTAKSPAKNSTERIGKNDVRRPDMAEMKELIKDAWGHLPAKAREQMLQSSPEQFLPQYEILIEKYYKRLAEQQKTSQ